MKRIHILGMALVAIFAFSAVVAAPSFAEVHLWLIKGESITALTSVEVIGELLLEDTKTIAGSVAVLCSGILDGSVGAEGEDEITEVLTLEGAAIAKLGATPGLLCTTDKTCENNTDIEVFPENLPWHTQLELMAGAPPEETLDTIVGTGGEAGYTVKCLVLGLAQEDTCSGNSSAGLENMPAEKDVLAIFNTTTGLSEKGTCTQSKEKTGEIVGEGLIVTLNGEEIAVSPN